MNEVLVGEVTTPAQNPKQNVPQVAPSAVFTTAATPGQTLQQRHPQDVHAQPHAVDPSQVYLPESVLLTSSHERDGTILPSDSASQFYTRLLSPSPHSHPQHPQHPQHDEHLYAHADGDGTHSRDPSNLLPTPSKLYNPYSAANSE
ncbi:hypothetical protein BT69DRAFT_1291501, partial [Atractiella rhizophila]